MTRRQKELATIHCAKRDLVAAGVLTEDGYRTIVDEVLDSRCLARTRNQPSSADLDAGGRSAVIRVFRERLGWHDPAHRQEASSESGRYVGRGAVGDNRHLTQEQADEIARLEDELRWDGSPNRLRGFIRRVTGKKQTVEMLGGRDASAVISGLRKMAEAA